MQTLQWMKLRMCAVHCFIPVMKCLTKHFIPCSYVVLMPKKRQALVEYEDMIGSCNAVTYANDNQIYIAGHPAFINYSTSQKISRPGDPDDSRSVNNVLLFTIMNPIYPITTVNLTTTTYNILCLLQMCSVLTVLFLSRMFCILFVTTVVLFRESSSSGRMVSRPWWNILLWFMLWMVWRYLQDVVKCTSQSGFNLSHFFYDI